MTAGESFDATLRRIEALITGRNDVRDFGEAYQLALQATQLFPDQPTAWSQLVLTANLTDRHDIALEVQASAETQCPDWTDVNRGDCERDHALYSIRHRNRVAALKHIVAAREFHAGDADRLALLDVVEGQWWYMLGEYGMALRYFLDATVKWEALTERSQTESDVKPPRPQWCFNSDRRLLKAIVALQGSQGEARELYASLSERMADYGSPDIAWRLRLVMTGRIGNWLDTRIESSPLSRRVLPKVALLVRRLLPVR